MGAPLRVLDLGTLMSTLGVCAPSLDISPLNSRSVVNDVVDAHIDRHFY